MGQKEAVEYNRYGQLFKQTDFKGQSVELIYDTLGRKTAQKYFAISSNSATEEITFSYDNLSRIKTIVTPQGTTENTYNARGELIQVSTPEGSINYAYDVKTGAKTRVWTLNSDIRYTYDAMNRLKTVEVHKRNGVELGTPEVTTYDYTKVGSRASISLPNGITTSYQYDSLNRLTNLTHKKADTLIASYTYNLLPAGRRSAVTEVTPEGTSQINYTYDNLYRLTNETRTGVNPFTASYAYDINSNRTQKIETVNGITETINYEYNANDQLLSEVSSANGTTVYTYDVNGSLTNKANEGKFSYQYGYDLRNRLATANITRKEGTVDVTITSSYAYNADGIRTRALQTINGITQNRYFLLDDGHTGYAQVFEETAELGGSIVRSYTIGDDVLSQTVAGVTSHLLYDGHGSTRQLADNNGTVTANYAYDAYGKMLGGNPGVTDGKTSATDLLYAGEQFDPGLQMEYLRARYYDQDNGRFNRLDPFEGNSEDPQSLHKYTYAHCEPVGYLDPSGKFSIAFILTGVTIGFVAINLAIIGAGMFMNSGSISRRFSRSIDDLLAWYPWFKSVDYDIYNNRWYLTSFIPKTPYAAVLCYRDFIMNQNAAPPELVASILYAEMRHYNLLDTLTENDPLENMRSKGIAQLRVDTVKGHGYLPETMSDQAIEDLITYNPTAILLLTMEIQWMAKQLNIKDINDYWNRANESQREDIVQRFTSAKDTNNPRNITAFGTYWGITSYRTIREDGMFR